MSFTAIPPEDYSWQVIPAPRVAACLLVLVSASLLSSDGSEQPTLRCAADKAHILVGAAVRPSLFGEPAYAQTLRREFSLVEPEDAMKWSAVRREKDSFDYTEGDAVVRFAQAHGMKVRGHCLVWDHDNPDWLSGIRFSPKELNRILEEHISNVVRHYAGEVFAWDVVNEAFDENGQLRNSTWYNQSGIGLSGQRTAYIEQAFRWAHAADPQALLFYNDNGAEGLGPKSDAIFAMLKDFKARSVPIDGIGLQMHIASLDFDAARITRNLARLTALGLQVHITELDVSLPVDSTGRAAKEDLHKQAEIYGSVVRACLQNRGCTAIQTWGFTDKYSWIGSHSHHSRGAALPFDAFYRPKPAYESMLKEISISAAAPAAHR